MPALGISAEGVARIRSASPKGLLAADAAIEAELKQRQPLGPDAKAATEELAAAAEEELDILEEARADGTLPRIHGDQKHGYSVHDGRSGKRIGRAADMGGATRLAALHLQRIARAEESDLDLTRSVSAYLDTLAGSISGATGGQVKLDAQGTPPCPRWRSWSARMRNSPPA